MMRLLSHLRRRLATIPGVGTLTASAIASTTPEVYNFRSARDDAAWLGLTPQLHSSSGKERLGRISKAGTRYLRRLLYPGASCRRHASGVTVQIAARRCGRPGRDSL
jgi:transposase